MGNVHSLNGKIGFDTTEIARLTGTNVEHYAHHWHTLSWNEAYGRREVEGGEGAVWDEMQRDHIRIERNVDCREQTFPFLRKTLFEPHKESTAAGTPDMHTTSFSTNEYPRCWYPWGKPKELYVSQPLYLDKLYDMAESEYGIHKSRISIVAEKRNNVGYFHIALDHSGNPNVNPQGATA